MRLHRAAIMAFLTVMPLSGAAKAAYVVNVTETGTSVLFSGSGSINSTLLSRGSTTSGSTGALDAGDSILIIGTGANTEYESISGPASFGQNFDRFTPLTTGPRVGIIGGFGSTGITLVLPEPYVADDVLGISTALFENASFTSLGVTPGSYVYSFGGRAGFDTFTINVGPVPLPASAPLFGAALLGLAGLGRAHKRRKAAA